MVIDSMMTDTTVCETSACLMAAPITLDSMRTQDAADAVEAATRQISRVRLLDSGAGRHVFNSTQHFSTLNQNATSQIITGGENIAVKGAGMVTLKTSGGVWKDLKLHDVALAPTFPCNVVSYGRLEDRGILWDTKGNRLLLHDIMEPICDVIKSKSLYYLAATPKGQEQHTLHLKETHENARVIPSVLQMTPDPLFQHKQIQNNTNKPPKESSAPTTSLIPKRSAAPNIFHPTTSRFSSKSAPKTWNRRIGHPSAETHKRLPTTGIQWSNLHTQSGRKPMLMPSVRNRRRNLLGSLVR
ncbi:hypothetical protein BROUX41_006673 [Berkeleyomyces rouxiae]